MKVHKLTGNLVEKNNGFFIVFDLETYPDREAFKNKIVTISLDGKEPYRAFFTNWGCPVCGTTYWGILAPQDNLKESYEVEITVQFIPDMI